MAIANSASPYSINISSEMGCSMPICYRSSRNPITSVMIERGDGIMPQTTWEFHASGYHFMLSLSADPDSARGCRTLAGRRLVVPFETRFSSLNNELEPFVPQCKLLALQAGFSINVMGRGQREFLTPFHSLQFAFAMDFRDAEIEWLELARNGNGLTLPMTIGFVCLTQNAPCDSTAVARRAGNCFYQ